ncbi:hypothetical protein WJX73_000144 [Symbiochloris irregularis]|uniref:Amine oxidase domain-containing protein n=1 Tax=Symbiochloris irregularis TaxID=706552 RepID=A0AAW1PH32_9CHLO
MNPEEPQAEVSAEVSLGKIAVSAAEQAAVFAGIEADTSAHYVEPRYLDREPLIATVMPSHAELALCCLYANRYYTPKRLAKAAKKLGHTGFCPASLPAPPAPLSVHDEFVDRRCGVRMVTFVSPIHHLAGGGMVAAAVFTFRGTRLNKAGTLRADFHLIKDRNTELLVIQRALKHVSRHMRRLQLLHPTTQWAFFTTGHSLGGFTAISTTILCHAILRCVAFESPGLTTFYHRLARERGDAAFWQDRVINYLAIPNPINMCQHHLGLIFRVHFPRIETSIDLLHIFKCMLGTAVRLLNWGLMLSLAFSMLRLILGATLLASACSIPALQEASPGSTTSPAAQPHPGPSSFLLRLAGGCDLEATAQPAALATSAFWTLKSAAAFVAARLGTTVRHVLQQHSMWHMAQAFNPASGLPFHYVEMESWPKMLRLSEGFLVLLGRAVLECFWSTNTSEGVSVLLDRNAMIEARIAKLPGYVEVPAEGEDTSWLAALGDVFGLWSDPDDEPTGTSPRARTPSGGSPTALSAAALPVSKMEYPAGCIPVEDNSSHASDLSQTDVDFTTDAADESESEAGTHHPHHRHLHPRHGRSRAARRHVHYAKLKNSPLSRTQRTGLAHIVEGSGESAADDEGEDHESEAASARILLAGGVRVTVLEAGERVGGRAHTTQLGQCGQVELGATWLHGLRGSPVYEAALKNGLMNGNEHRTAAGSLWGTSQMVQQGAGTALDAAQTKLAKQGLKAFVMAFDNCQEVQSIKQGRSVADHLLEAWHRMMTEADADADKSLLAQAFHWRELLARGIDGCDRASNLSPECLSEYVELPGPNMPLPCGYSAVARAMAEGLDIRFGHCVTNIHWHQSGADVTCQDGTNMSADAIICTLPLGVLKAQHQSLFDPPLPVAKTKAIARIGMGIVDKIFIDFSPSSSSGNSTSCSGNGTADSSQSAKPIRSYQLLWQDPSMPFTTPGSTVYDDSPPDYDVDSEAAYEGHLDDDSEDEDVDALDADPSVEPWSASLGCAAAWIAGEDALQMERASDDELHAGITALLDSFPALRLPRKFRVHRTTWGTDPLALGSYSFAAKSTRLEDFGALEQSLQVGGTGLPVLLFAGEAMSAEHAGTTHGACFSGRRAAAQLLKAWR